MTRHHLLASAMALTSIPCLPAYAQEAAPAAPASPAPADPASMPADTGAAGNDIVVTAQFRSQRLQDTPLAITAVNAATLEARGQTSIYQVAAQAPNVTLQPAGQSYGSGIVAFIRGVGQNDNAYALEPGVGIYVDDVYYSTLTGSLLDLMDLDRVEVLRGPQGTLAGKNSIGGAVKLYSKKPTGDGSGTLQATYGSYNRTEVRGSADITIVPETLFARFSGAGRSRDGYVTRLDYGSTHPGSGVPTYKTGSNGKLGTLGGQSYVAGRAALRWLATPAIEVNVAGDYTNDKSEPGAGVLTQAAGSGTNADGQPWVTNTITGAAIPYDCRFVPYGANSCDTLTGYNRKYVTYSTFLDATPATSQSPFKPVVFNPRSYLKAYGGQGTIDWNLSDAFQLKSITGYRHYANDYNHDEDGSPLPHSQVAYLQRHSQFSEELRLNAGFLDNKLKTTFGAYYFKSHSSTTARVDLNYTGLDFIDGPDKVKVESKAAFAQAAFAITDAFNLSGGVRYTDDRKNYLYQRHNPDGTVPTVCEFFLGAPTAGPLGIGNNPNCLLAGLDGARDSARSKRTDWRAVVDYRFSPSVLAYAQVSTGFKGGGVNPYPYYGPGSPSNQIKPFGPETLLTYEGGLKTDFFDRRVRINVAAFLNKYKDIILRLSACPDTPCDQPNNIGKADVKGFELEAQLRPVDGLSFDGSFSYLDFEYKRLNGNTPVRLSDVTPYTPKYKWSAGVQYDYDASAGIVSGRLDASYQSSVFTDPVNAASNRIDGYTVANGRLSYTTNDKDWQIAVEVQNIFEKYYYQTLIQASQYISAGPGLPRTWSVTLRRNF